MGLSIFPKSRETDPLHISVPTTAAVSQHDGHREACSSHRECPRSVHSMQKLDEVEHTLDVSCGQPLLMGRPSDVLFFFPTRYNTSQQLCASPWDKCARTWLDGAFVLNDLGYWPALANGRCCFGNVLRNYYLVVAGAHLSSITPCSHNGLSITNLCLFTVFS